MVNVASRLPTIGTRMIAGSAERAGGCDARGSRENPESLVGGKCFWKFRIGEDGLGRIFRKGELLVLNDD